MLGVLNRYLLLLLLALTCLGSALAQQSIPPLGARVSDYTKTLSASEKSELEGLISRLDQTKGSQIAVLIVPTTQPEAIEQYAIRLADTWKIGRKGVDDGVILVVAKNDRKMRIEVGYGLEGALNDATCKRIIDELITPYFKQGKFFEGIKSGVENLIKVINNEPLPNGPNADPAKNLITFVLIFILFGAFVALSYFFGDHSGQYYSGSRNDYHRRSSWGGSSSRGGGGFSGGGGSFGGGGSSGGW
ncbi:MAG: TPM domain-containing protein [Deltaproteobacteria bacterium]|nr:TPM domain-containing protein [Deltaproteobacteria bacterium]